MRDIETVRLTVHQYVVDSLLDRDIVGDVETRLESLAYHHAMALSTRLRLLGENTEPRLLAEYPATLWDHAKKELARWFPKLTYRKRYVWQDETVVYPSLPADQFPARIVVRNGYTED